MALSTSEPFYFHKVCIFVRVIVTLGAVLGSLQQERRKRKVMLLPTRERLSLPWYSDETTLISMLLANSLRWVGCWLLGNIIGSGFMYMYVGCPYCKS